MDPEIVLYVTPLCAPCDRLKAYLRSRGVAFAPSQFEAAFVSTAHTPDIIEETLEVARAAALDIA